MFFKYDRFNRLERPDIFLAKPNKDIYGVLNYFEPDVELYFNGMSKITFKVYKYLNGEKTMYYDDIEGFNLVEVTNIGWFQIADNIVEKGDGSNKYKEITVFSLENELTTKILTSFGSMGTETDDQGGLDRYTLFSITDPEHSILHLVIEKAPSWKVGYIDPAITTEYRSFNNDSVDAYSFLTGDVSKAFDCIFIFDTYERSINAYKLTSIGELTGIYLAYRNLVNTIEIEASTSEVCTVMNVCGGDDRGTTLGIIEVNPAGTNYISNFSYFYHLMSEPLQIKLKQYEIDYQARAELFAVESNKLQTLYNDLNNILNRVPSTEHSTNWSEYGLTALKSEFEYYDKRMSLYLNGKYESERLKYYNIIYGSDGVQANIDIRQAEYDSKLSAIEAQQSVCDSLVLDLKEYLGSTLYKELSNFVHYGEYIDDTYVVTSIMSEAEIYEMKKSLLDKAHEELEKVCKPNYKMKIDLLNFLTIPEFRDYAEQLKLGDIVTVEFDNDVVIESRLLKISFDFDSKLELTFSSKNRLEEGWAELAEIQQQIDRTSNAVSINGSGWNIAKKQSATANKYMSNALDASLQMLRNSKDEEFTVTDSGTKWRKKLDDGTYSPRQMWGTGNGLFLTQNAWSTVSVAIGEIDLGDGIIQYGIAAPLLLGTVILGERLQIKNTANTFTIDENGLVATNNSNTIKLNPNNSAGLIEVSNKTEKILYFDSSGTLTVKGKVVSSVLEGSTIKGGSININDRFIVNSNGDVTLPENAVISWGQITNTPTIIDENTVTRISRNEISTATIHCNQLYGGTISANLIDTTSLVVQAIHSNGMVGDYNINRDMSLDVHGGRLICYTGTNYASASYYTVLVDNAIYVDNVITNTIKARSGSISISSSLSASDVSASSVTVSGALKAASAYIDGRIVVTSGNVSNYAAPSTHSHPGTDVSPDVSSNQYAQFNGAKCVGWYYAESTYSKSSSSDIRLKYDISTLANSEELILGIKTKEYRFKDVTLDKKKHAGVIAQQLISLLTSLGIDYKDSGFIEEYQSRDWLGEGMYGDTFYRVNYEMFIPYLIDFCQKMYQKIEELEKV